MASGEVHATEDAREALAAVQPFLLQDPARHNLALTILHAAAAADYVAGRFWWVSEKNDVTAVAFQAPKTFKAGITAAGPAALDALVDAMVTAVPELPGVIAEAEIAAAFAGRWATVRRTAAAPEEGQLMYRLDNQPAAPRGSGELRLATEEDRELLMSWTLGFLADTGAHSPQPADRVLDQMLEANQLWLWTLDGPASMAAATDPIAGVARVRQVYTPSELRRRGYAFDCVSALSARILDGPIDTCVLYTQLTNPTSNAIYQALGYRAFAEVLHFRFGNAVS